MSNNRSPAARRKLLQKLPRSERRELRTKVAAIKGFARGFVGIQLRPYQIEAADAVVKSVLARDGNSFVIMFARQSGKDELLANLILFILARLGGRGTSIVCAQPTFRPQTVNAMERLRARAAPRPFFSGGDFHQRYGYIFRFLASRVSYFSADPSAHVVGPTADRLLIINEAQDVDKNVYDRRFAPMAAAGNATRVFSGTAWTCDTLLEREKLAALEMEKRDGLRRLFIVDADQVARHNELYGVFVQNEIRKLGRDHPLVRTQYFCENLDAQSGMFTAAHRSLMQGDQPPTAVPQPSISYVFLLDVAGQEESSLSIRGEKFLLNAARDAVTLRIASVDLSTLPTLQAPTYRVVHTLQWTGANHSTIYGQLKDLGETWRPLYIVIDATGVGEGLWSFLDKAFPTRVIPVKFTQQTKSELGYGFLAIINTGRFRDCTTDNRQLSTINRQYAACESEILIGPAKTMRWGVPEGRRDEDGHLIHDDIPVTDSLTAVLDRLQWTSHSETLIVQAHDPLDEMSRFKP